MGAQAQETVSGQLRTGGEACASGDACRMTLHPLLFMYLTRPLFVMGDSTCPPEVLQQLSKFVASHQGCISVVPSQCLLRSTLHSMSHQGLGPMQSSTLNVNSSSLCCHTRPHRDFIPRAVALWTSAGAQVPGNPYM